MKKVREIALFIPTLEGGGAERFMIDLANGLSSEGDKVYLVVGSLRGRYFSEISSQVEIVDLQSKRILFCLPKLVKFLRSFKPDALISTIYHSNMVAIASALIAFSNTKVIVRDSNMHQTLKEASSSYVSYKLTCFLMRILYRRCHAVVAVSQAMKEELSKLVPGIDEKLNLVHNFIDNDQIKLLSDEDVEHPWLNNTQTVPVILSVGRLSNQKNWPLLLHTFSDILKKREIRLIILGEGEKRKEIESLIHNLGIQDNVSLPGFVQNPFSWMAKSEIFVLSSDAEGFPNVLVQALSCGCKVISSDCESGPREILEDGKWGYLCEVGNLRDLSSKIELSIDNPIGYDTSVRAEFFSKSKCIGLYNDIIDSCFHEDQRREIKDEEKELKRDFLRPQKVIAFFVPSLEGGGAERFMVNLANEFSDKGNKVYLVASSLTGSYISEVSDQIEVIDLRVSRVLYSLPKLIFFLRTIKPSILISTIYHANMVSVTAGIIARSQTKIIIREDNMNESLRNKSSSFIAYQITFFFKKFLYKMSHAVVVLSNAMGEEIKDLIPGIDKKVNLIYNFVDLEAIENLSREDVKHPWLQDNHTSPVIVSAGRLSDQKNWPLLLRAFALNLDHRDIKLIILGEGEKRKELEGLIVDLGIQNNVSLPGFKQNPFSWMARSDIFALSSNFEGCPNVILQALCCGCKIISSDCESGPREILEDGKWGELFKVGDISDLSRKIKLSLDEDLKIDPRERAKYFTNDRCIDEYEKIFLEYEEGLLE